MGKRKTHEEFVEEMKVINPDIEIIGEYITNRTPIKCICKKDGHEWSPIPTHLLKGGGCPVCANKVVVPGINDIPTTAPWMVKYFQGGYDEAKLYTCQSNKKIYPICPDCGRIKNKPATINNIYRCHSIWCVCGDSLSYPNKFAYAFLEQLQVSSLMHEYNPDWLKPYRYDNYFEYKGKKYILEMDGGLGHGNIKIRC